jgi:hypothetical protein
MKRLFQAFAKNCPVSGFYKMENNDFACSGHPHSALGMEKPGE